VGASRKAVLRISPDVGINPWAARVAVTLLQLLAHKGKADVLVDLPQQVAFRNLIFQPEVVEQRFGAVVLSHHDQQSSENGHPAKHGKETSSFLLPRFPDSLSLITVPPVHAHHRSCSVASLKGSYAFRRTGVNNVVGGPIAQIGIDVFNGDGTRGLIRSTRSTNGEIRDWTDFPPNGSDYPIRLALHC
jgi:hypothetical protein